MTTLKFLTVEQVLSIHDRMIAKYGGTPELRDRGLLESAVAMPTAQFGGDYLHEDLVHMAAAYLFHICKNHPFVDGNKRTALASTLTFLARNSHWIDTATDELEKLTLGVADSSIGKQALAEALRKFIRPDPH